MVEKGRLTVSVNPVVSVCSTSRSLLSAILLTCGLCYLIAAPSVLGQTSAASKGQQEPAQTQSSLAPPKAAKPQISVRTDKGIYRVGERPRITGRMLIGVGNPATGFARIQVNRRIPKEVDPEQRGELIHDSIVEVRAGEFSDESFIVQMPRGDVFQFSTNQIKYWVEVIGIVDTEPQPKAHTEFMAEEVGVGGTLLIMAVPLALLLYMLLLVFPSFMQDPTKKNARSMLSTIYVLALIFLFVPLLLPLVISISSELEALLRTTPVGFLKASTGRPEEIQWVVNIGGVSTSGGVLRGGVGIPLLVLVVSTLGAAINMLRKLPDFLKRYDEIPESDAGGSLSSNAGGELRGDLLKHLVYVISAPFIAMATYSLMLIADYTNPHAVAIVAFSVGFISDTVVEAILEKSKSFLTKGSNNSGQK